MKVAGTAPAPDTIKDGAEVTVSDGNTLVFTFGDTYKIVGTNNNTDKAYTYDSSTGNITSAAK